VKFTSKQKLRIKEETSSKPNYLDWEKGVTPELIHEVSKQLDENAIVKIRILQGRGIEGSKTLF